MKQLIQHKGISLNVESIWAKALAQCSNPLGLDDATVKESLEKSPPKEYMGATWCGRYIIPLIFVNNDVHKQPRDKSNDKDHVNALINNYEVKGYLVDSQPPFACFNPANLNPTQVDAETGFNRRAALGAIGQDCYIYDIYEFDTPYNRVVARNVSNHHSNPQLSQTKQDYIKETCNAIAKGYIPRDEDAIRAFVDLIAADKTPKSRQDIAKQSICNANVFPNFRTYTSQGSGPFSLNRFISDQGIVKQGVEGRSDADLKAQGYISYCSSDGGNKSVWMRGIYNGIKLGLPVWVFGYAPNREADLDAWRLKFISDWNGVKGYLVEFAFMIAEDSGVSTINEDDFTVKLGGFFPHYVKPNPEDLGRETEHGLVDVKGNPLTFDPNGSCLTLVS